MGHDERSLIKNFGGGYTDEICQWNCLNNSSDRRRSRLLSGHYRGIYQMCNTFGATYYLVRNKKICFGAHAVESINKC